MAANQLQAIIEPAVTAMGYELVGVEYLAQGRHSLLRIYIDSEHGITLDDCAEVSHQVSAVLDVEDVIKGVYNLEVSSPGMNRPLFTAEHFVRFSGEQVEVKLRLPLNGRRKFKGTLQGVHDNHVVVEVDGEEYSLPIADIDKANLVAEW